LNWKIQQCDNYNFYIENFPTAVGNVVAIEDDNRIFNKAGTGEAYEPERTTSRRNHILECRIGKCDSRSKPSHGRLYLNAREFSGFFVTSVVNWKVIAHPDLKVGKIFRKSFPRA
jgi:hypothetical protein